MTEGSATPIVVSAILAGMPGTSGMIAIAAPPSATQAPPKIPRATRLDTPRASRRFENQPAPMTRIIIVVLPLVAAVSACQYPACVEADRLARQCGGGGHCAELRQTQKRACDDVPGGGHSFGSRAVKFAPRVAPIIKRGLIVQLEAFLQPGTQKALS